MLDADKEDLATHQFYSARMLEVFRLSKSSALKPEISDSRETLAKIFAQLLSLRNIKAADYHKLAVYALGPWAYLSAVDSEKCGSLIFQMIIPQFIRGEADLNLRGLFELARPVLNKLFLCYGTPPKRFVGAHFMDTRSLMF